jgi:hypothetical protein
VKPAQSQWARLNEGVVKMRCARRAVAMSWARILDDGGFRVPFARCTVIE